MSLPTCLQRLATRWLANLPGRDLHPLDYTTLPGRTINLSPLLSSSGQVPVLDAVGLVCCSAETGLSVRLIFRVVSLEPDHLAVTLKRKHMSGDAGQMN